MDSRWTVAAALGTVVLGLGALHLWWLHRFRDGFAVDIDETGYLWFAYHLHDELLADGLPGVWQRIQGEGWVGPLLPVVTALAETLGGTREVVHSMAVQLLFFAVLVLSSYGIGRRLLDRRAGVVTAVVVATVPAVTDFVRTYHLVMATTAMYALATYALLQSDRLRRRGWVIVWGVALGLTLLSRSMAIAFLPALPLAAGWILVVDRADRRRFANFALGLSALTVVAVQWYASSWRPIADYLFSFGYGEQTPGRGVGPGPVSLDYWTDELIGAIDVALYVPTALVMAAAFVLAAAAPASHGSVRAPGWVGRQVKRAARSDAIVPGFVVVEGYLALTSSSNDGTGFVVPLLPALVALAVVAALRVRWRSVRVVLVAALLSTSVFNVVMKADVLPVASEVRTVRLPVLGGATLTNGRGFFHQHLVNEADYTLGPPTRWLPDREKGWLTMYDEMVSVLYRRPAELVQAYVATTEPLLNSSALRLAAIRSRHQGGIFGPVDTGGEDTVQAYRRFLAGKGPGVLVTASRQGPHFGPSITQHLVEAAASSLGFERIERLRVPDGRELHLWVLSS
jgi:hypothetical protein